MLVEGTLQTSQQRQRLSQKLFNNIQKDEERGWQISEDKEQGRWKQALQQWVCHSHCQEGLST